MKLEEAKQILNENGFQLMSNQVKVETVKEILTRALKELEHYNDNDIVNCQDNSYFVKPPFLGTVYGFIDLRNIDVEYEEEEEEA